MQEIAQSKHQAWLEREKEKKQLKAQVLEDEVSKEIKEERGSQEKSNEKPQVNNFFDGITHKKQSDEQTE